MLTCEVYLRIAQARERGREGGSHGAFACAGTRSGKHVQRPLLSKLSGEVEHADDDVTLGGTGQEVFDLQVKGGERNTQSVHL